MSRRYRTILGFVAALASCALVMATPAAAAPRRTVRLTPVANVDTATAMAARSADPTLYVAEQAGRVVAIRDGAIVGAALDIRSRVAAGGEQGLLGLAFSPDGSHLYVDFTNHDGNTRIEEYAFARRARRREHAPHRAPSAPAATESQRRTARVRSRRHALHRARRWWQRA